MQRALGINGDYAIVAQFECTQYYWTVSLKNGKVGKIYKYFYHIKRNGNKKLQSMKNQRWKISQCRKEFLKNGERHDEIPSTAVTNWLDRLACDVLATPLPLSCCAHCAAPSLGPASTLILSSPCLFLPRATQVLDIIHRLFRIIDFKISMLRTCWILSLTWWYLARARPNDFMG